MNHKDYLAEKLRETALFYSKRCRACLRIAATYRRLAIDYKVGGARDSSRLPSFAAGLASRHSRRGGRHYHRTHGSSRASSFRGAATRVRASPPPPPVGRAISTRRLDTTTPRPNHRLPRKDEIDCYEIEQSEAKALLVTLGVTAVPTLQIFDPEDFTRLTSGLYNPKVPRV